MTPDSRVAVVGLGYVGLPLAVAFAEAGLDVEGIDVSEARVATVGEGRSPIDDISDDRLGAALAGRLRVSTLAESRVADADAVFVCVPTPIKTTKDPDLGPVLATAGYLRDHIRGGQLIVLQSTTYPGTTMGPFRAILEEERPRCRAATSTSPMRRSASIPATRRARLARSHASSAG